MNTKKLLIIIISSILGLGVIVYLGLLVFLPPVVTNVYLTTNTNIRGVRLDFKPENNESDFLTLNSNDTSSYLPLPDDQNYDFYVDNQTYYLVIEVLNLRNYSIDSIEVSGEVIHKEDFDINYKNEVIMIAFNGHRDAFGVHDIQLSKVNYDDSGNLKEASMNHTHEFKVAVKSKDPLILKINNIKIYKDKLEINYLLNNKKIFEKYQNPDVTLVLIAKDDSFVKSYALEISEHILDTKTLILEDIDTTKEYKLVFASVYDLYDGLGYREFTKEIDIFTHINFDINITNITSSSITYEIININNVILPTLSKSASVSKEGVFVTSGIDSEWTIDSNLESNTTYELSVLLHYGSVNGISYQRYIEK